MYATSTKTGVNKMKNPTAKLAIITKPSALKRAGYRHLGTTQKKNVGKVYQQNPGYVPAYLHINFNGTIEVWGQK